ncbi:MAG: twin-arginine translocase TatA/TatE family subunit [Flavobacteriales bacterium]|nr:twin-arginine translocase TatA/TatE family subunit [Flavobacteriales bacterium]
MSLLFLNSISGGEILVILLIVLMFFGADSIPSLARNLGRGIRQIKDATQEIQRDIANSANNSTSGLKEIKEDIEKVIEGKEFKKDKS